MAKRKALIKSRFMPPYDSNGNSNIGFAKDKAGVYIIKEVGADKFLYIGFSASNVYKTCLRHFQSWDDNRQVRVTYKDRSRYVVRIILTTAARAEKLERALIVHFEPKDNPDKLKGYKPTKTEEQLYQIALEQEAETARAMWEDAPF